VSLLMATAIKTTLVLLGALGARALMRGQPAAVRHWLLAVAIGCALLMPAFAWIVPAWRFPALMPAAPEVQARVDVGVQPVLSSNAISLQRRAGSRTSRVDIAAVVVMLWFAGTLVALATLVAGLVRLAAIAKAARPAAGPLGTVADDAARAVRVARPVRLLYGDHPAMPVTWGLIRPTIILPESARAWTDDRLHVVLCHELAHIRRGDWGAQLVAELLRAVYWFNPVAWIACRRLRLDSEHACDDAVLNAGVAAPAYASHLLAVAYACAGRRGAWSAALPVARPSGLERRVRAMLNTRVVRHPLTRRARLAIALAFSALAIPLAGVASLAQGPFATVAGSITDPTQAALPDATLAITNNGSRARNEVRSDPNGRFEFVGLPPGDYVLEASVPGFRHHRATMSLNGQQVDRDIVMDVGAVTETVSVVDSDAPPRVDPDVERKLEERRLQRAARLAATGCPATQAGGVAIGGNIRPPLKLVDVRPEYPRELREARVGGTVDIEARIATDGSVRELRPDSAAHPDLTRAAVDAVREWRFAETLLNCVPIEVSMTVHVTFTPRQ
jgi:TonB family protein